MAESPLTPLPENPAERLSQCRTNRYARSSRTAALFPTAAVRTLVRLQPRTFTPGSPAAAATSMGSVVHIAGERSFDFGRRTGTVCEGVYPTTATGGTRLGGRFPRRPTAASRSHRRRRPIAAECLAPAEPRVWRGCARDATAADGQLSEGSRDGDAGRDRNRASTRRQSRWVPALSSLVLSLGLPADEKPCTEQTGSRRSRLASRSSGRGPCPPRSTRQHTRSASTTFTRRAP